ncbi:hypothetical protein BKA70DRAFT_1260687 [Coprinopsis sp. MPI-PUGE-AT-0042]|nr:hypothetical protein BKA70DRAFT_1260687 [Coprinopsis sp. MPI-PUGE-AT-0042]
MGRTNSSGKIGNGLQFTQRDLPVPKHTTATDKGKKAAAGHGSDKNTGFQRQHSSQRVQSKEHIPQPMKRAHVQQPSRQGATNSKAKSGFTISSPTEDDDDEEEDDDEWVSSSSGAVTPNHPQDNSDSDPASDNEAELSAMIHALSTQPRASAATGNRVSQLQEAPELQRVDTARGSDFTPATLKNESPLAPHQAVHQEQHHARYDNVPRVDPPTHHRVDSEGVKETHHHSRQTSPRTAQPSKRSSRPASTYSSASTKVDGHRPHPLIRGQSFGTGGGIGLMNPIKPSPLAPVTAAAPPHLSTSPTSSVYEDPKLFLPGSPASTSGGSFYPSGNRRTSISSTHSVSTLPPHTFRAEYARGPAYDRKRTLSALSNSSSSAALSALSHIPAVTRPPSPQSVVFFPPINPHANVENIHPLLPGPYLNNHLAVLARRVPLRESYDRVIKAKRAMA